jgi:uncharacterized protein (DUF1778 family)
MATMTMPAHFDHAKGSVSDLKKARVEFKTYDDVKERLQRAARLQGLDLSSFMLSVALEKADKILAEHEYTSLSAAAQQRLVAHLNAKHSPTQAMKDLMALPDLR